MFAIRLAVTSNRMTRAELADIGVTPESLPAMLSGTGRGWVAEADHVMGFAMADARAASVFALFVSPDAEGHGLGSRLMDAAEGWLFRQGLEHIWLVTDPDRNVRANGFYRHRGWQSDGLTDEGEERFVKTFTRDQPATSAT